MIATAIVALAIFALYSESKWPRFAFGLIIAASLVGAAIAAVLAKGEKRAFCIGAAMAGLFVYYDLQDHSSLTQVMQTIRFTLSDFMRDVAMRPANASSFAGVVVWSVIGVSAYVGGLFGAWVYHRYHEPE